MGGYGAAGRHQRRPAAFSGVTHPPARRLRLRQGALSLAGRRGADASPSVSADEGSLAVRRPALRRQRRSSGPPRMLPVRAREDHEARSPTASAASAKGNTMRPDQRPARRSRVRVERGIYREPSGNYAVCVMAGGKPRFRTLNADLERAAGTQALGRCRPCRPRPGVTPDPILGGVGAVARAL